MINRIKKICEARDLVEIYTDKANMEQFEVGYIEACNDDEVLVHSISPYGADDGFYWESADDIFSLRYDTDYLKNLKMVMEQKKTALSTSPFPKGCQQDMSLMRKLLDYAMENNRMVRIMAKYYDLDAMGVIVDYDETTLDLQRYFIDGTSTENIIVLLEDLKVVSVEGQHEWKTELARDSRNKRQ
ncbi:MAG: hypothetical protein MJZ87_06735 [Bacteroidales bacterium]|nr:hypothetical protein [Bacteroidales bacterium]